MAVQVLIHRNAGKVVFDQPANVQQSDLVFWHNQDAEAHYPVPGCGGLRVAAGQSTAGAPFVPFPDVTKFPYTLDYVCALHDGESGTLVIDADQSGQPPAGSAAIAPAAVPVHIRRSGGRVSFDTIDVAQGDTVYWVNDDTQAHWPVPNCTGLLVEPGMSSNATQPATSNAPRSPNIPSPTYGGPAPLPLSIAYGCAIPGHEGESGTINVYDNLAVLPSGAQPPLTGPGILVMIVTGGKSPYTIVQDPAQPSLVQQEMIPPGSSSGVAVIQNGALAGTSVTLQVHVTDGLGKTLSQATTIPVQEATK